MNQDRKFLWRNHWKQIGWAQKLGGEVSQGITRVEQTVIAKSMESQIWYPPAGSMWGRLRKGTTSSASTSVWEKSVPPTLILMPENSLPPCMSLVLFKLLAQCWSSEGVSASKSICRPCKRTAWDFRGSPFPSATIPAGFYSQKLGGLLFLVLEPWAGGLVWDHDPLLLRRDLRGQDILPDFYLPHMGVGPACSVSLFLFNVAF